MSTFPAGILLDATGTPYPPSLTPTAGFAPTTIIVEPGGGRIALTESDHAERSISYADIYATQPAVGAVVNKLYRSIATLPLKVYQWPAGNRSQNGKPVHPEEVHDPTNSLVALLEHPAPGYGAVSLKEWLALPYLVHGNSLVAKFRGNGPGEAPTEIIPLDWRFLQAWARIGQPVLVWGTIQTGVLKWIAPSETIYTAWTSPAGAHGAWLGTSPLSQLGTTIKIDEAAQRFAAASFKNAARPSGIVVLPPEVNVRQDPDITTRLRKQLEHVYGGVDNAYRIAVLGGGAEWKQLGVSSNEAQLTQTRQWDLQEVAMVYDIPVPGDTLDAERAAQFYRMTLRTHLSMIADRMQSQLVEPEREWSSQRLFVRWDINEVLYGDPLALSDKMVAEVNVGIRSRDEARVALGLAPRGGPADDLIYAAAAEAPVGQPPERETIGDSTRETVTPGQTPTPLPAPTA